MLFKQNFKVVNSNEIISVSLRIRNTTCEIIYSTSYDWKKSKVRLLSDQIIDEICRTRKQKRQFKEQLAAVKGTRRIKIIVPRNQILWFFFTKKEEETYEKKEKNMDLEAINKTSTILMRSRISTLISQMNEFLIQHENLHAYDRARKSLEKLNTNLLHEPKPRLASEMETTF